MSLESSGRYSRTGTWRSISTYPCLTTQRSNTTGCRKTAGRSGYRRTPVIATMSARCSRWPVSTWNTANRAPKSRSCGVKKVAVHRNRRSSATCKPRSGRLLHLPLSPSLHALHTEGALPNRRRWADVRSSLLSGVEREFVGAFSVNLPVAVPPHEALAYVLTIYPREVTVDGTTRTTDRAADRGERSPTSRSPGPK